MQLLPQHSSQTNGYQGCLLITLMLRLDLTNNLEVKSVQVAPWFRALAAMPNAICKDQGWSPTYHRQSFSPSTRFILNNQTPTLASLPCAPINQLTAIRGTCKGPKKNNLRNLNVFIRAKTLMQKLSNGSILFIF